MQAYNRMRIPIEARPFALRYQVVQAIRRSQMIDGESAYQDALKHFTQGDLPELYDGLHDFLERLTSRELEGKEIEAACPVVEKAARLGNEDFEFSNVDKFNRDFLNGNGLDALRFALLVDAAELDLKKIDEYRGGSALQAAYGPRRTQAAKRAGPKIQAILKEMDLFDEYAMSDAADHYIVYRHVHRGNFTEYKIQAQLTGQSFSEHHRRESFNELDRALGYAAPERGRPPSKRLSSKTPLNKPLQRKVRQERL